MAALAVSRHPSGPVDTLGGAVAQLGERLVRNEEVRGSTPLGSTSLRWLRRLRLGEHQMTHHPSPLSLLRHPAYVRFLYVRVVATIALQIQVVAVGWQMYELTNSPFQ